RSGHCRGCGRRRHRRRAREGTGGRRPSNAGRRRGPLPHQRGQVAASAASAHFHAGVWALAVLATGALCGFSTVTVQGTDPPAAIVVGPARAVAVTTWLVVPDGSVKFTSTGKGEATTAIDDELRTTPETEVRTTGGRLARKELAGTELSTCWSMCSTVATTPPAGHTAGADGEPSEGTALVGACPSDGAAAEPARRGAADA